MATNSTASLAFYDRESANDILASLKAEKYIIAACLFDQDGNVFSHYPLNLSFEDLPDAPQEEGYHFEDSYLSGFQPVVEGNQLLGTLYLKFDAGSIMYNRILGSIVISVILMVGILFIAFFISKKLQKQISHPVLALAGMAQTITDSKDYSMRAIKYNEDELGILTDAFNNMLSQIQQQNHQLSESEERVRAVLNSTLTAVIVMDVKGMISDWNNRAEIMFGWKREDVLGKQLAETIIPLRYRQEHQQGLKHFQSTGEGPILNHLIEMNGLRHDGSEFPVELSISVLKTADEIAFCGFITDITERKQAERKLQAQLTRLALLSRTTRAIGERQDLKSIFQVVILSLEDHLPIDFGCICLYDSNKELLTVESVGQKSRQLAKKIAMSENTLIHIDENGLSKCIKGQLVYEPDIAQSKFPFPQQLARGGIHSLVIAPLLVESSVFGVLVAARFEINSFISADCEFLRQLSEHIALASHQTQLYNSLQQAYDDLRHTQQAVMQQERLRALGQMASGIAHDINNAITPVSLYAVSLLENEPNLSPRARKYLQTIEHAIDDVSETVARMREFYRQREPQLIMKPVQLNNLLKQVIDLTQAKWSDIPQQYGVMIKMQTSLNSDLPEIMGVESEIREALTNLIFNAVDAMPEGGIILLKTLISKNKLGTHESCPVKVEIRDTGIGMSDEIKQQCLEPFYTTKGERGTGLGLAMVYGTMQRHKGEIEIESQLTKGTTIRLGFPKPATISVGLKQTNRVPNIVSPLNILIVDDDPVIIKSLRDALEDDKHTVFATNGGQAGIDAFKNAQDHSKQFDVVITDLGMPYVDGRKVAGAVKSISPSTPVILLTGWGKRMLEEDDIPPNVDCVLGKPPKMPELREALSIHCLQKKENQILD
jgi:PAS domain S-box-containing protein